MSGRIVNVRQAAKILGVSTNTMYKYLNKGIVSAPRGHGRGNFHIPVRALETFLGDKIPIETISDLDKKPETLQKISPGKSTDETNTDNAPSQYPSGLAINVIRWLLLFGLILIIVDTITTTQFNPVNQLARIFIIAILALITYQHGGFVRH